MRNVLITGMPRSGTTLVCSLLNKLPETVALHEPMNVWEFAECRDAGAVGDLIENFCAETRKSLREHGFAISNMWAEKFPIMSLIIRSIARERDCAALSMGRWLSTNRFRRISRWR
jgi:hypothetical protein